YLIKDTSIVKEEKTAGMINQIPPTVRHFILNFEVKDYLPQISDALDYFFTEVIHPGDTLQVVTPVKTYKFRSEALSRLPPEKISEQLKAKLKVDIKEGNARFRTLMRDFYHLLEIRYPPDLEDLKHRQLFDICIQMRDLTDIQEKNVLQFADALKTLDGQKHVFLFYQKDVLPNYEFGDLEQMELLKPVSFDVSKIKQYYSDASVTVHFLFITKEPQAALHSMSQDDPVIFGQLRDLSGNIFGAFNEMAKATGGLTESTQNPAFALRQASEASRNYYLLYYRPQIYRADGGFRRIEVKVKGGRYRITHRSGYIAD
ncbi:MAG: hypothetical protein MUP70_16460, partial [Candidatus Aminicenantes bacterium]|nr:hypothetical protein [Candidatus Aminicenantes bacterium]